jgi:hypothetical protein
MHYFSNQSGGGTLRRTNVQPLERSLCSLPVDACSLPVDAWSVSRSALPDRVLERVGAYTLRVTSP